MKIVRRTREKGKSPDRRLPGGDSVSSGPQAPHHNLPNYSFGRLFSSCSKCLFSIFDKKKKKKKGEKKKEKILLGTWNNSTPEKRKLSQPTEIKGGRLRAVVPLS